MKSTKNIFKESQFGFVIVNMLTIFLMATKTFSQCDPSTIDPCEIGNNSIIQAAFHAQIAKTSNGYSITGQDFAPSGTDYSTALTNIPSAKYPMPDGVVPVWGAIGGRTQAVFIGSDNIIYAIGEEDLLIDISMTQGPMWGKTNMRLPSGITVCDINKWQGAAGSGSDNNNSSNATGDRDGFLVFSTYSGEAYITGDGAKDIQAGASNIEWTMINMPTGISVVNYGLGYRTLLILGSDGNLYAAGPKTYLGDDTAPMNTGALTMLLAQPEVSIFGISQIEAGFHSYFVLDGDGTIHVMGENSEGALGVGHTSEVRRWSKVGKECSAGELTHVAYISTMSTHDHHISSSAILVDGTIRSWGSNHKQSITSGGNKLISCPIKPTGNNRNAVAISNGGHISPYVNSDVQICNIGHNRQGAFGDGQDEEGDYGEYRCRVIPGRPEICGTKEANLRLSKTVSNTTASTGNDIVFTITVRNSGPEASTGSFVRDQLSPAFYYLSDDSNGKYNYQTGLWTVGPLAVGASTSLNITVKVIEQGSQTNYAQILVDNEVDINSVPGNDSSTEDDDDRITLDITACPISESDALLCPGDSIFLDNAWIFDSGLYLETYPLDSDCDSLHFTKVSYVEAPPEPQVELDCDALEYKLTVNPLTTWLPTWENGDQTFTTTFIGTNEQVLLTLENSSKCMEIMAIDLAPLPDIENIPVFEDVTILENSLLELTVGLDPQEWQIQWLPESIVECSTCMNGRIITDESTVVTLQLEHVSGCVYESSFFLTIEKAPEHIYIPNVFSPNADSFNDKWTFFTSPNIKIDECNIYDRWGNLIFKSSDQNPIWDGRYKGKDCVADVYVYMIVYQDSYNESQTIAGDLTLIR